MCPIAGLYNLHSSQRKLWPYRINCGQQSMYAWMNTHMHAGTQARKHPDILLSEHWDVGKACHPNKYVELDSPKAVCLVSGAPFPGRIALWSYSNKKRI